MDLPEPGQAGGDAQAPPEPTMDLTILRLDQRTRPHEAHLAGQDVEELAPQAPSALIARRQERLEPPRLRSRSQSRFPSRLGPTRSRFPKPRWLPSLR
jgi:hypothetical protein